MWSQSDYQSVPDIQSVGCAKVLGMHAFYIHVIIFIAHTQFLSILKVD